MKRQMLIALLASACGHDDHDHDPNELISRVELTFAPTTGTPLTFVFDDPDGDGGAPGTADPVELPPATAYMLEVAFYNALGTIPEDITLEIRDEAAEHQVFFTGSAVVGPATSNQSGPLTITYADTDVNGLPIGLTNTVMTAGGTGDLIVTLRHMPPSLPPQKSADSAGAVKTGGFGAIGGDNDAQVTFPVTVQ